MWPFHRDAECAVARAPAARTDEYVAFAARYEIFVDFCYFLGNLHIALGGERLGADVHYMVHVVGGAMSERCV